MTQLKKTTASSILLALLIAGCSSQNVRIYKKSNTITIPSGRAVQSQEKIDQYATFLVYFKLEAPVDSIRIGITSEYIADISGRKKTKKNYFIVEKAVDVHQFKNIKAQFFYMEMGRNFDPEWNREKEITITSESKKSPFKLLDDKSVFRIRFTTFSPENLDFAIKIDADCGVTFMDENK